MVNHAITANTNLKNSFLMQLLFANDVTVHVFDVDLPTAHGASLLIHIVAVSLWDGFGRKNLIVEAVWKVVTPYDGKYISNS